MIKKLTKSILIISCSLFAQLNLLAQTTIYSENFNSGNSGFLLNTADEGCDLANVNFWIINQAYQGGPIAPSTPGQPVTITGAPTSAYLHIKTGFTQNALFSSPANGNVFAKMGNPISTIGYSNVSLKFWLLCNGDATATNSYFGRTYYSTDGGNTWIQNPSTYSQISSWTQVNVSNAAFNNQADLRFGFMWVQNSANAVTSANPAYSVDEITLQGTLGIPSVSVTTGAVIGSPFCGIKTFNLDYNSSGTFEVDNTFTVQLSDANGSFVNPTLIGTGSVSPIACAIPDGTVSGSGYLVRVVASSPAIEGSASTLSYFVTPTISTSATSTNCNGSPSGTVTVNASGGAAVTNYSWSTTPVTTAQTVSNLTSGTYYVTVTYGGGCNILDSAIVTSSGLTLSNSTVTPQTTLENPDGTISFGVTGGQAPYTYSWNTTPVSTLNSIGSLSAGTYICIVTDATGCSVEFSFSVPNTVGINEIEDKNFEVFPNPTKNILFIKLISTAKGATNITLFDLNGKIVLYENNILQNKSIHQINISELSNGVYFLQIVSDKRVITKRVIKAKN